MNLNISEQLALPPDFATDSTAVLAKKGAGKTYTGSVIAEEYSAADIHFVVVDPTGAWFGLRSNAAGNGPGLPIVIFGGEHADVPISVDQGEAVANFIVEQRVSCVLDMSGFRKGEQIKFMLAFAERLYHINREVLALIIDEADAYAPQRPFPEVARLLGAIEDLVRRGRRKGIGTILITQRPAVLNKNVLEQCDNLFVLQITGPNDRKAIEAWVAQHGTPEELAEVNKTLATLKKGETWVWSPTSLGILKRVQIRKRNTFDSGRTPKVGETLKKPTKMADVDLDALRKSFAVAVDVAEANDPVALRAEILRLEKKLEEVADGGADPNPDLQRDLQAALRDLQASENEIERLNVVLTITRAGLDNVRQAVLGAHAGYVDAMESARPTSATPIPIDASLAEVDKFPREMRRIEPTVTLTPPPVRQKRETVRQTADGALSIGPLKLLAAITTLPGMRGTRTQIGMVAGYAPTGGTFQRYMSTLRSNGLVVGDGDQVEITALGRTKVPGAVTAISARDVQALWCGKLQTGPRKMLEALLDVYPKGMTRAELGQISGYEPAGGTFQRYFSTLRSVRLIEVRGHNVVAASALFPPNARS